MSRWCRSGWPDNHRMDRFDRFTDEARKVLTYAQDEAQRFNHNYIGTEHMLLGVVRVEGSIAARVLENMNVELSKVRTAVEFIIGRGQRPVVAEVGLTRRGQRVLELAIEEAGRLRHDYIGPEHLLLGLVREGEGLAAGILASLGVRLERVRQEVLAALQQGGPPPNVTEGEAPIVGRRRVSSGSPYEQTIGFSRAIRVGARIVVSGTAPIWPDGSVDPDPEAQARRCLEIIVKAVEEAGGSADEIVRTRMYLTDAADAEAVGRAHAAVFGEIRPAATMVVVAGLLDERWKVEIEAEAVAKVRWLP